LDEVNKIDASFIEALFTKSAGSLLMSGIIVDELRKLDAKQRQMEAVGDAYGFGVLFQSTRGKERSEPMLNLIRGGSVVHTRHLLIPLEKTPR
jgi:hypothetical protein